MESGGARGPGRIETFAGMPRPVLTTERLRLDTPTAADVPAIVALAGDLEVSRWLARVPHPYTASDASFMLDQVVPRSLVFAVRRREDGVFMGVCGLEPNGELELGYWLGRPYWGAGYATEAAAALLDHAFGPLGRRRVLSGVFDGNARSANVLKKLGFRETGRSVRMCRALGSELVHIDLVCERPGAV